MVNFLIILNPFCVFLVSALANYFLADADLYSLISLEGAMRASNAKSILKYLSCSFSKNLKLENINIFILYVLYNQPTVHTVIKM